MPLLVTQNYWDSRYWLYPFGVEHQCKVDLSLSREEESSREHEERLSV